MTISVFSAKQYDRTFFDQAKNRSGIELTVRYHGESLSRDTVSHAKDATAVCVFVNDVVNADVLKELHVYGVRAILLRCAGYNNVDLVAAEQFGFFVANVPSYSPESVAEYAVALVQSLNRKTYLAHDRVRLGNFTLDGLLGFALNGKTVGIIGTGKIGVCFARIMHGFGCRLVAYDPFENEEFAKYGDFVELGALLEQSDIVSLHCPLLESTRHIINKDTLKQMKPGAMLVNVSRGGLVDTDAVIESLKERHLSGLALDVYEREGSVFYTDHSTDIINDDALMRLVSFPNVIITGHQAFFTGEALTEIASVTLDNMMCFSQGVPCKNNILQGSLLARQSSKPLRI
ncbi:hypothetical protein B0A52_05008 [Exophiala mesophila]|uniref:D-lactate dehydrogenase n=1 Tax=Exophiala mesophila TaxID=212818 RepID=A0A438N707_EXOME|nr:hypothetical protein B0A52_05008 [Exophiala mesophila]